MAPSRIKLTYFQTKGRAEISRLILAQAGVDYEDVRLTRDEWAKVKPNTLLEHLPVLECDGQTLGQSMSIARFLAKEFNLAGKDNWEQARADMIGECVQDFINGNAGKISSAKDEAEKKLALDKIKTESAPPFLDKMEKLLMDNGGKRFVGSELTYADLAVFNILDGMYNDHNFDNGSTVLRSFYEDIADLPRIKAWRQARPKA